MKTKNERVRIITILSGEIGEWKVFTNDIHSVDGGFSLYHVGRRVKKDQLIHFGNIEFYGSATRDKAAAEALAKRLNECWEGGNEQG